MASDRERLLEIAEAVADGAAVDWDRADTLATTDDDRRLVRSLRLIAEVGSVHDSVDAGEIHPAPAPERGSGQGSPVVAAPLTEWGRYELREQLGAGAQGAVYRAWDPQLECEVALKVLQPRLAATDQVGERMLREGRALARVRHQHVVNVYAAEVHEGQVGLCMEFIKGRTLEEILSSQGPLGSGEAATIGLKVGRALAAVHAAGIVHRDVKARNVMREEGGRIVLMDFGTGKDGAQLARDGAAGLAGTPLYMAPEVLAGDAATQQSDVYSVGVLLYYLVSGQYPVEGKSIDAIVQAHVRGRRRPLIERRPDLPEAFVRIVDKALAADPETRYENAAAMVHELASLDANEADRVLPPRTVTQRVLLGAGWLGIAAIALVVLGFVTSMGFNFSLERVGFAGETPFDWLVWGLRGLVAPLFDLGQWLIRVLLVVVAWRGLRRVSPAFDRAAARLVARATRFSRRLGLADVDSFGQIAFVASLVALAAVLLLHLALLSAMTTTVTNMTVAQRSLLSPDNRPEHLNYRAQLDFLVLAGVAAAYRLSRMRRRQPTAISAALLTALLAVLAHSALMWAAPYRLFFHSERDVVRLDGGRCYDLGHEAAETLVYCPDAPRLKVQPVADGDPRLERTGDKESVFAGH